MKSSALDNNLIACAKLLPRGYLSWSQLDLLERSPMEYVEHYIRSQPRYESEAMMFGKTFDHGLETGEFHQDEDEAFRFLVQISVPKLELMQHEVKVVYKGISLLGKLDTVSKNLKIFRDYKTGSAEWSQAKVNGHGQLVFYSLLIFLKTGKIPKEIYIDWIKTYYDEVAGEIKAYGDFKTIRRKPVTLLELSEMTKRIEEAVMAIAQLVKDYSEPKNGSEKPV